MFLSKISYSPKHLKKVVRRLRGSLFREHKMIWDLFHNNPDTERDFLYRREDTPGQLPFYYLLSMRAPDNANVEFDIQTKEFNPLIRKGDRLAFNLRANAVVTKKVDSNSKKRIRRDIIEAKVDEYKKQFPNPEDRPRPSVIHQEAAEVWLGRQGERSGFSTNGFFVENHRFHKMKKPSDQNIRQFTSLDFNGQLIVNDSETFIKSIYKGLGRSKAFGCGLMLIRRI